MNRFRNKLFTMTMLVALLSLLGPATGLANAKDKEPATPKIKLRVEVFGITGDNVDGSIDAFGSDQLITVTDGGTGGGGAGKAIVGPLVITKDTDGASPKLFSTALSGAHIKSAKISWLRTNPVTGVEETYMSALLLDVQIISLRSRVADQRDPQALQGATVEDIGFDAFKTELSFLRPDGTVVTVTH